MPAVGCNEEIKDVQVDRFAPLRRVSLHVNREHAFLAPASQVGQRLAVPCKRRSRSEARAGSKVKRLLFELWSTSGCLSMESDAGVRRAQTDSSRSEPCCWPGRMTFRTFAYDERIKIHFACEGILDRDKHLPVVEQRWTGLVGAVDYEKSGDTIPISSL